MNISWTFRLACLLSCCLLIAAAGCSAGNGDGTTLVYGTVTFDGSPLESGKVILEPVQAGERPYAASIHDGKFQLSATPGKKIVRITATRLEDPKKLSADMKRSMEVGGAGTVPVQYIPAQYNQNSELTVEIDAAGGNQLAWDLTK
ncbi:hypothetical protein Pan97_12340 [Bremerella volcania]|uniref:Carboxypeptidase regulatory-like domain-containing protein n=1 Tax=Bremerella volcania TaxID=2527984 RepID=A0A518C4S3_9BACT|nr:hypothetical protein [Bremerella volcania]QDU74229.1 hypothetical protein Pan97_12340 [Bremerella volcania]